MSFGRGGGGGSAPAGLGHPSEMKDSPAAMVGAVEGVEVEAEREGGRTRHLFFLQLIALAA
jgi:hypothetical protein